MAFTPHLFIFADQHVGGICWMKPTWGLSAPWTEHNRGTTYSDLEWPNAVLTETTIILW